MMLQNYLMLRRDALNSHSKDAHENQSGSVRHWSKKDG